MPLEKVGIRVNELRGRLVATIRGKAGRARKGGDVGREGGRRVAAVLLPTLLRRRGTLPNQVARCAEHHRIRIKVPERPRLMQSPREDDGKRNGVELNALP